MLYVCGGWGIPESELSWSFARAGGPGGQNVNKVASKAVLRWDVLANATVPEEVRAKFREQQRGKMTLTGEIVIQSQRFRDQERNRQDCIEKLVGWLQEAAERPKKRRPTKPSRGSKEARLQQKKRRSGTKRTRQRPTDD
jgi:ribosome-associated protein